MKNEPASNDNVVKLKARGEPPRHPTLGSLAHAALVLAQGTHDPHVYAIDHLNKAAEELREHARATGAWESDAPF